MFGSEVLEVGVGVTLILLFISLICTAAREALEIGLRTRAADLERGIRELLKDRDGTGITRDLYSHPLIQSLFLGDYDPGKLVSKNGGVTKYMARAARSSLPSYIPAGNFASAILDIVRTKAGGTDPLSAASLRDAVGKLEDCNLRRALLSALDGAENDLAAVKSNLEMWFNGTMDRVSGWYKRRTQTILFVIGLVAAITLNVDIITVAQRLSQDKAMREGIVSQAESIVSSQANKSVSADDKTDGSQAKKLAKAGDKTDTSQAKSAGDKTDGSQAKSAGDITDKAPPPPPSFTELNRQLELLGYPIGWQWEANSLMPLAAHQACQRKGKKSCALQTGDWLLMAVGWLVTALAVMLGAPFWFDVLNKFMVVRSTVKPREKSREEGSEDRAQPQTVSLQLVRPGGK
jgi:hypothetical protein